MATPQETEELKVLEAQLDVQLRIMRSKIDDALQVWLVNKNSDYRKNAIDYYMQQLHDIRHIIKPEVRVERYKILVDEMLANPQQHIQGFPNREPENWSGFRFSDDEKEAFKEPLVQLKDIQGRLNDKKATIAAREARSSELEHRINPIIQHHHESSIKKELNPKILTQLDKSILELNDLEQELIKSNRNPIKSAYKDVKQKILTLAGRQHVNKLDIVRQMKAELTNLRHSLGNTDVKLSPDKTIAKMIETEQRVQQLMGNRVELFPKKNNPIKNITQDLNNEIQSLRNKIQNINKDAITPITSATNNILIEYANTKYGNAHQHFGKYIQEIDDNGKFEINRPPNGYKANDPNLQTGDYLNFFYPDPKYPENRDQLSIRSYEKYTEIEENKQTELSAICSVMTTVKSLQVNFNRLKATIDELGNDPELYFTFTDMINADIKSLHSGIIERIEDPTTRSKIKELCKSMEANVNEYCESLKKESNQLSPDI